MRAIKIITQGAFIIVVLLGIGIFFAPSLPVIGHLEIKIVKSGSMEPAIMTGGIVVIREVATYREGDVVTFTSPGATIPTTHRIVGTEEENGRSLFVTKGDANEERDTALVAPEHIIGKVLVSVPYLGFVLDFARQPLGFALIIGVPAFLIVFDEIEKIWREVRRRRRDNVAACAMEDSPTPLIVVPYDASPSKRHVDIKRTASPVSTPTATAPVLPPPLRVRASSDTRPRWLVGSSLVVAFALMAASVPGIRSTLSFFSDTEASTGNYFEARALDFALDPATVPVTFIDDELEEVGGFDVILTPESTTLKPLVYTVSSIYVSGTAALCDAIAMDASLPFEYTGTFNALSGTDIPFDGPWHFDFSLNTGDYLPGDSCVADIVFAAQFADAAGDDGYLDTESVRFTFGALANNLRAPALIEVVSDSLVEEVPAEVPAGEGDAALEDETKKGNAGGNSNENNGQAPEKPEKPVLPIPIVTEHSNENGHAVERLTELEEARTDTPKKDRENSADDFEPTPTEPEADVTPEEPASEPEQEAESDPAEDSEPEPTPEPEAEVAA